MFQKNDVVRYQSGTEYLVCAPASDWGMGRGVRLSVVGWKNGQRFGAYRTIDPTKCIKVGVAEFSLETGWSFTPAAEPADTLAELEAESAEIAALSAERQAELEAGQPN